MSWIDVTDCRHTFSFVTVFIPNVKESNFFALEDEITP